MSWDAFLLGYLIGRYGNKKNRQTTTKQKPKIKFRLYCPKCKQIIETKGKLKYCPACGTVLKEMYIIEK